MPIELNDLNLTERGEVPSMSGDQPTSEPVEIRGSHVPGQGFKIPEIQVEDPDLRFIPVYRFQTQRHLLGLQERLEDCFHHTETLQKGLTEQRNGDENGISARQLRGRLNEAFRAQDKAFDRYFSFIVQMNTVYGRDKPRKSAMSRLIEHYENMGLEPPKTLTELDPYEYRLLEPTRGGADKRLSPLLEYPLAQACLSRFKEREGKFNSGGRFVVYNDEALTMLAEGIVHGAAALLLVLSFVLITSSWLSNTTAVVVCLLLAAPFSALMMLCGPEPYLLAAVGYLALSAALLQARGAL